MSFCAHFLVATKQQTQLQSQPRAQLSLTLEPWSSLSSVHYIIIYKSLDCEEHYYCIRFPITPEKEGVVLQAIYTHHQPLLCFSVGEARVDQGPEARVVQVVDVA